MKNSTTGSDARQCLTHSDIPIYAYHYASKWLGELVATFGLVSTIWGCSRVRSAAVPFAVAAYITGAYWFTSSTSFANPAVTMARAATNTFAGIRPSDVPLFVLAQLIGAGGATVLFRWLVPALPATAPNVVASALPTDCLKK